MDVPVISIAQMRQWEDATWESGQTEAEVIRRVGLAVAVHALRLTRSGDTILILAGKGHNGDDARAARDHLPDRQIECLNISDPSADFAGFAALLAKRPALVIDGLFGIGISRPLAPAWVALIQHLNGAKVRVLSVDVPSGLNADTGQPQEAAVQAVCTLTVGAPKRGLLTPAAWPYVGRLEVACDVGLVKCPVQSDLHWTAPQEFENYPPPRPVAGHKGSFGHVALICGSVGYHGAGVLAARGAQRARPGLISLYPHAPAYLAVAAQLQSVMVHPWETRIELPEKCSSLLVGPGLAARDLPKEIRLDTLRFWKELEIPIIVDASALAWLPADSPRANAIRVITPHPGEAARMLRTEPAQVQASRQETVRQLSRRFGDCWVILKGHQSLIGRSTGPICVNSSGNPWLAQGGAGDLLGGYLAGLLAQPLLQQDVLRTLRYAVWQHGAAADRLQNTRHNWTVEELADEL